MSTTPTSSDSLNQAARRAYQAGDRAAARRLWVDAVRQSAANKQAWLGLLRVSSDPAEQYFCLLALRQHDPDDPQVRDLLARFIRHYPDIDPVPLPELNAATEDAPQPAAPDVPASLADPAEDQPFTALLQQAAQAQAAGDDREALQTYKQILDEQPAQSEAVAQTARLFSRYGRLEQAEFVLQRSIQAGNRDSGAYITLAQLRLHTGRGDPWEPLEALRGLPDIRPEVLLRAAEVYTRQGDAQRSLEEKRRLYESALGYLLQAEQIEPENQQIWLRLSEVYRGLFRPTEANQYLQRLADRGGRSDYARQAQELLLDIKPHVPRAVQVGMRYALREVLGIFLLFFLLALLDAGVSLTGISLAGWLGMVLSVVGGYLLVSATSSPSQRIFHPLLAGVADDAPDDAVPTLPDEARYILGTVGGVILAVALVLVLNTSLASTQDTLHALGRHEIPDYLAGIFQDLFAML